MRGGGLEWMNYFRGLPQPHKFEIPFDMYLNYKNTERSKIIVFYVVFKT